MNVVMNDEVLSRLETMLYIHYKTCMPSPVGHASPNEFHLRRCLCVCLC